MTGDEGGLPSGSDPPAAPVVVAVQVIALLGLIGYAVLALVREVPVDAKVIAALLAFGVGLRPSSIARILRKVVDE